LPLLNTYETSTTATPAATGTASVTNAPTPPATNPLAGLLGK
jgi:hypothetical protein